MVASIALILKAIYTKSIYHTVAAIFRISDDQMIQIVNLKIGCSTVPIATCFHFSHGCKNVIGGRVFYARVIICFTFLMVIHSILITVITAVGGRVIYAQVISGITLFSWLSVHLHESVGG